MKKSLIACFLCTSISSPAYSFTIGKYKLGMTTSQAKSIGYHGCTEASNNRIKCTASDFNHISHLKTATISFDIKTRRVVEIHVTASTNEWESPGFHERFISQLKLAPCSREWTHGGEFSGWCYAKPSYTRRIDLTMGRRGMRTERWTAAEVVAEVDKKHFASFIRSVSDKKKQQQRVESFENGK